MLFVKPDRILERWIIKDLIGEVVRKDAKRQALRDLVESWLADTSGYDKRVWPKLARAIEQNRLSYRKRLNSRKAKR